MEPDHRELAQLLERLADLLDRFDPISVGRTVANATAERAGLTIERIVERVAVTSDLARRFAFLAATLVGTDDGRTDTDGPAQDSSV